MVRDPEYLGRKRHFVTPFKRINGEKRSHALYDSERKLLEDLAHKLGIQYNSVTSCSFEPQPEVKGTIRIFVEKKTCDYCTELAFQLRDMLPKVNVIWMDKEESCF